jgi:hypothetical protein
MKLSLLLSVDWVVAGDVVSISGLAKTFPRKAFIADWIPLSAALYACCSAVASVTFCVLNAASRSKPALATKRRNDTSSAMTNAAPRSPLPDFTSSIV